MTQTFEIYCNDCGGTHDLEQYHFDTREEALSVAESVVWFAKVREI